MSFYAGTMVFGCAQVIWLCAMGIYNIGHPATLAMFSKLAVLSLGLAPMLLVAATLLGLIICELAPEILGKMKKRLGLDE